jgi:hypothetical protein
MRATLRLRELCTLGLIGAAAALPVSAPALTVTLAECGEGADFIRNAALSRDNGLRGDAFLERLEGDFVAIRAIRPELRWFARDTDDEALLRDASVAVFALPRPADEHRRDFLAACRATVAAAATVRSRAAAADTTR